MERFPGTGMVGAIDTPAQGGIAAGSGYANFGWVLTPLPNTIPKDGSNITVWVDGATVGHPVYNHYREDIASLFPGYNKCEGAVGYYNLDTTQYENGVHTISWSVTDDAGNTDGIGSRYFTIRNNSMGAQSAAYGLTGRIPGISHIPVDYTGPVQVIRGYNQNIEPQTICPDDSGDITIEIKELQRLEVHFSEGTRGLAHLSTGRESSTSFRNGYQFIGDRITALPVGSFLDSKNGIFSWQSGPRYLGDHELVFFKRSKKGKMKRQLITVRIRPKFE